MRTAVVLSSDKRFCEELPSKLRLWGFAAGAIGVSGVPELISHCQLKRPDLLVVDWSFTDVPALSAAIQKVRLVPGCRNTALYLIAPSFTQQVLSVAADLGAHKILKDDSVDQNCQGAVQSFLAELSRPSALRSHLTRIEIAKEKGAWGDVDRIAEDLIKLYPDDLKALVEFSNLCLRRENLELARHTVFKLKNLFPDDLRVVNLNARLLLKEGNYAEALLAVEKADILSPNNIDRLQIFGDIYRKRNDLETARAFYDQVLEVNPTAQEAQIGKGHVELSEGDVNAALDLFKSAVSGEELASIFNNAAIFAVRVSDFVHAHRLYEAALGALQSNSLKARVAFNQGLAFCKVHSHENAFRSFQQSFKWDAKFEKNMRALRSIQEKLEKDDSSLRSKDSESLDLLEEAVSVSNELAPVNTNENTKGGIMVDDDPGFERLDSGLPLNGKVIQVSKERSSGKLTSHIGAKNLSKIG